MSKGPTKAAADIDAYDHAAAKRRNIPTAENQGLVPDDEKALKTLRYPRNPDLDPQLVWRGKDKEDESDLEVQAPPIYVQEKIKPEALIADLKRRAKALAPGGGACSVFSCWREEGPSFDQAQDEQRGVLRDASSTGSAAPQDERSAKRPLDFAQDDPSTETLDWARLAQDERRGEASRGRGLRTSGGEPVVVRTKTGKLQLRLAQPGKLTKACEQAFLAALSASANVRLSAAAAGASVAAFYRRRQRDAGFRREFRMALAMGYERLEMAALRAAVPESHGHDAWRHNDPPPIPPMSADQAIQLLCLHEKSVHQSWEQPHRRRRRNESDAHYRMRLFLMWRAEQRQLDEERAVARALRFEETGGWRMEDEQAPVPLPPLHLVTGWSRADPAKTPQDPKVALFGGWRLKDMKRKLGEG